MMGKKDKSTINHGIIMNGGNLKATNINFNEFDYRNNLAKSDNKCVSQTNMIIPCPSASIMAERPIANLSSGLGEDIVRETPRSRRLFVIYSAADCGLAKGLQKQIQVLALQGLMEMQPPLKPGTAVYATECMELAAADAVVMLLSADFFCEERCRRHLAQALKLNKDMKIPIVPVRLRAVTWEETELGGLRPIPPEPHEPIAQQSDPDAAWKAVLDDLQTLFRSKV